MTSVKFVLLLIYLFECNQAVIINQHVARIIDIEPQIVKARNTIVFKNQGANVINSYDFVMEPGTERPFVKVFNEKSVELHLVENFDIHNHSFTALLDRKVNPNDTYRIIVELACLGNVIPFRTRKQNDTQMLQFKGNVYFFSPYATSSLKTTYNCERDSLLTFTFPPHSRKGNQLVYKYSMIKPYSLENLSIVFENNEPILVVTDLLRTIDVSHFGKIFVEDGITLENKGNI